VGEVALVVILVGGLGFGRVGGSLWQGGIVFSDQGREGVVVVVWLEQGRNSQSLGDSQVRAAFLRLGWQGV
jgi:hypothetical protein